MILKDSLLTVTDSFASFSRFCCSAVGPSFLPILQRFTCFCLCVCVYVCVTFSGSYGRILGC